MTPYVLATSMSGIRRSGFFVPTGEKMARAAVATIGIQKTTFGCFAHALQVSNTLYTFPFHLGYFKMKCWLIMNHTVCSINRWFQMGMVQYVLHGGQALDLQFN